MKLQLCFNVERPIFKSFSKSLAKMSLMPLWIAFLSITLPASLAHGRFFAADLFCRTFPTSPSCSGSQISCGYCHQVVPPNLNSFGYSIQKEYQKKNLVFDKDEANFTEILRNIHPIDSDGDGFTNLDEITQGTLPGFYASLPDKKRCLTERPPGNNSFYRRCQYDPDYAYKKVWGAVCGEPPLWEDFVDFKSLPAEQKPEAIKKKLLECLDQEYWIGKNGVVWEIGHYKIRPVGSVKSGEDETVIGLVDYYDDYHLFVWTQIDGHDARDVLLADYGVKREVVNDKTVYSKMEPNRLVDGIVMQPEYRAGLLTSFWTLGFYLNYTAVARVLVAQAFNAFVGISLATMQGLNAIDPSESLFEDYDDKGVTRPECAECHRSIDPMTYPYRNYNGLSGSTQVLAGKNAEGLKDIKKLGDKTNLTPLSYSLPRMEYLKSKYPRINEMPEAGFVLGQKVSSLREWATVVANSDPFAAQTVRDYWKAVIGHDPLPSEQPEFQRLWKNFKTLHQYSVESMLVEMITLDAFGTP